MMQIQEGTGTNMERIQMEMLGLLRESVPGQRWVTPAQRKTWCPPTDVYETDAFVIVKVEIAGMTEQDFSISLDANRLTVSGVRHDPAAKLVYQQMEIPYGQFETHVHLPREIDIDQVEATYQQGFLIVRLPKAKPHQIPVVGQIVDPAGEPS